MTLRDPDPQELKKLHRFDDGFAIATLLVTDGETLEVAAGPEQRQALLGPFDAVNEPRDCGRTCRRLVRVRGLFSASGPVSPKAGTITIEPRERAGPRTWCGWSDTDPEPARVRALRVAY